MFADPRYLIRVPSVVYSQLFCNLAAKVLIRLTGYADWPKYLLSIYTRAFFLISQNEPGHMISYTRLHVRPANSDHTAHPRRLIRGVAVRLKTLWNFGYPQNAPRRLWSDCADAQSDLNLRWSHMQSCRLCPGSNAFIFQLHWNNPDLVQHLTDSSGMKVYYTPNLRQYDAELFVFGQEYLSIPPMTDNITYEATCPSDCTIDMFKQKVYITRAINHMHYLGMFIWPFLRVFFFFLFFYSQRKYGSQREGMYLKRKLRSLLKTGCWVVLILYPGNSSGT